MTELRNILFCPECNRRLWRYRADHACNQGIFRVSGAIGLGVLSLVTASLAAMFVETEERKIERDLLHEIALLKVQIQALSEVVKALGFAQCNRCRRLTL